MNLLNFYSYGTSSVNILLPFLVLHTHTHTSAHTHTRTRYTWVFLFSLDFFMSAFLVSAKFGFNRPHPCYRKSIHDFAARICGTARRNDKDNEAGPDMPMEPGRARGDGSTWTVFDCREINDPTRIYPFGSLNRRWSRARLITSALHRERDCSNVTGRTTQRSCPRISLSQFFSLSLYVSNCQKIL